MIEVVVKWIRNNWLPTLIITVGTIILLVVAKSWSGYVVNNLIPDLDTTTRVTDETILNTSSEKGHRGDVFGGTLGPLIAWIASILTFLAFWIQYKANQQQREDLKQERFENRFFKFIDYHRENVNAMKYRDPKTKREKYWEGNQVFTVVYYEIKDLLEEYMKNKSITNISDVELKAKAIDFIYQCVFFGKGKHSFPILKSRFDGTEFEHINFVKKRARYCLGGKKHFYYTGHVRRLGHYFQNVYQAIKYVDEQNFLSERQKYEYVSILRAQMSVYEQAVFFYNSISVLGDLWEWANYRENYPNSGMKKSKMLKRLWVTKYDLIHNAINNNGVISDGININDFYPLINLERENEFEQIGVLPFKGNDEKMCRFCFKKKYIQYYPNKEELKKAENEIEALFKEHPRSLLCSLKSNCETNKITNSLPIQS